MRISDWSSDVCSSDLLAHNDRGPPRIAIDGDVARIGHVEGPRGILPHPAPHPRSLEVMIFARDVSRQGDRLVLWYVIRPLPQCLRRRSEGRRVGKGCVRTVESRWSAYNKKKKK